MASLTSRTAVLAGVRWTASTMAQRSTREPCLVIGPRTTVVSDSRVAGGSAQPSSTAGPGRESG